MNDYIERKAAIAIASKAANEWRRLENPQVSISYAIGESLRGIPVHHEIPFSALVVACKWHSIGIDRYAETTEDACHHVGNIPEGDSWGECCYEKCPIAKMVENVSFMPIAK